MADNPVFIGIHICSGFQSKRGSLTKCFVECHVSNKIPNIRLSSAPPADLLSTSIADPSLLPLAYKVRGKVLFLQVSVNILGGGVPIQLMGGGGGYPIPGPGRGGSTPSSWFGEYPIPGPGGYPIQLEGVTPPPHIRRQQHSEH